jgi:taurine transport system permease protein
VLALALFLAAWWAVAELNVWPDLFVPDPAKVWGRLIDGETIHQGQKGLSGHYLHEHLWASLWRIIQGVGWAIPFGAGLGLLLATVKPAQIVLEPYVNFVRALPPLGYFSLLIIWFGIDDASKVWLLFLAAFPPIALSVLGGVRGIRQERIDAALALGARRHQVLRFVVLPSVLPELFTGIRLAIGFAWTTIVAAETVNGIPGIGGLAWETKKFQQTDVAVLCIIVIGLSAILLDLLVKAVERTLVPWRGRA